MILNAGFVSSPASIAETSVDGWWQNFEVRLVLDLGIPDRWTSRSSLGNLSDPARLTSSRQTNVKGTMTTAKAFLATANPSHAAVLGVTTGVSALPPVMLPGLSAYISSKLAQVKFLEFLGAENPNIFVASVHPGMVDTTIFRKSGAQPDALPMDKSSSCLLSISVSFPPSFPPLP